MRTTIDKYNKLCDMDLIQKSKYDINARIDLILADIQQQILKYEEEARAIYGDEKKSEKIF